MNSNLDEPYEKALKIWLSRQRWYDGHGRPKALDPDKIEQIEFGYEDGYGNESGTWWPGSMFISFDYNGKPYNDRMRIETLEPARLIREVTDIMAASTAE